MGLASLLPLAGIPRLGHPLEPPGGEPIPCSGELPPGEVIDETKPPPKNICKLLGESRPRVDTTRSLLCTRIEYEVDGKRLTRRDRGSFRLLVRPATPR